jgi:cytochrome c biogenesis protein CcmG/thiol:disulfide interchange protein DsbE
MTSDRFEPPPDDPDLSGVDPDAGDSGFDPDLAGSSGQGRSRVVLYSSLGVAAVIAVLIGVLAFAKPSSSGSANSTLVGKPAPAVSGPSIFGGGRYSLSQYAGRWVLVNFAASWCVPCRQETPQLVAFASAHHGADSPVILGVAFDPQDVASLAAFERSSGARWQTVNDPSAEVAYGVSQIPQSFLVSPAGLVAAKFSGAVTAAELDQVLARLGGQ